MALLVQNKVLVDDNKLKSQLIQRGFGEHEEKVLVLDLKEALYLLEKEKLDIEDAEGKKVKENDLLKYASRKEKNFYSKFLVYRDMKERGFCVKTGFKFGVDFRVYPRGKKMGEAHTYWTLHVMNQSDRMSMIEFSRMVRLAGNLKTMLLVAIVDAENDINYYEIERITP